MPRLRDITGNWFPDPILLADVKSSGGVPSLKTIGKYGLNPAVANTGSPEDVWSDGANLVYLPAGETMDIVSSDAADDKDLTTGAKNIVIEGLDDNWNEISETIQLEGLTPVTTVRVYCRINRAYCYDVGTSGVNVGTITIDATTATTRQASIVAGDGQTQKTQYTIPNGRTAYITNLWANVGKGDDATVRLMTKEQGKSWRIRKQVKLFESTLELSFKSYITVPATSDIRIETISGLTNGIVVSAGYDLYITGR